MATQDFATFKKVPYKKDNRDKFGRVVGNPYQYKSSKGGMYMLAPQSMITLPEGNSFIVMRKHSNGKNNNIITYAIRVIDAVDWSNTEASYKRDRYDLLLMPELGSMSQYVIKNLEKAYEKGYELGIRHIEEIKALLD